MYHFLGRRPFNPPKTQLNVAMGEVQSKTKLSEEDILFLEENTTMDRAKIMEWYEGFSKNNPSGQVDIW